MLKINRVSKYIIALFIFTNLVSCGPKVVYERTENIKNPWDYASNVTFEYIISDTLKPYNVQLVVGHKSDFTYENLYVNATTLFPDGKETNHVVSLQLADEKGDWLGQCSGAQCKTEIEISPAIYYRQLGKYQLKIGQYSRNNTLEGISDLTLKIIQLEIQK